MLIKSSTCRGEGGKNSGEKLAEIDVNAETINVLALILC